MNKNSEELINSDRMGYCEYRYKFDEFKDKQCPHRNGYYNEENGEEIPVCFWHLRKDGKDIYGEYEDDMNLYGLDLIEAYLPGVDLPGADLRETDLRKANLMYANLQNAKLLEAKLEGAILPYANLKGANLSLAKLQHANLDGADFQDSILDKADLTGANFFHCRWRNSTLKNSKFSDEQENIKQDSWGKDWLIKTEEVYRNLKAYFRDEGMYDYSGKLFIKEMKIRGLRYKENSRKYKDEDIKEKRGYKECVRNYIYYRGNKLSWRISEYGENSKKVLAWWVVIIFLWGTLYLFSNGLERDGEDVQLFDNYYFSAVTFSTLGFGDIQPKANNTWTQILAMSEALIGAMLMGFFLFTLARKIMR